MAMPVAHCMPWKHRGSVTLSVKARVLAVLCGAVTTPAHLHTPHRLQRPLVAETGGDHQREMQVVTDLSWQAVSGTKRHF